MQYYLIFIVLSILYLSINAQAPGNSTVLVVGQNLTVVETGTFPATTQHVTVFQTTVSLTTNTTTNVTQKIIPSSYVEPPPHPLGYCIRSRLTCSKIRRCCSGPCDVNRRKCP